MADEKQYPTQTETDELISKFRNKINHTDKAKAVAELVSDMVNNFGFDEQGFIDAMAREHRTLQQSFTRLVFKWIEFCAKDDYRFDGRNEGTHKTSKEMVEAFSKFKESELPDHWKGVTPSQFLSFI